MIANPPRARFESRCPMCSKPIEPGDPISYERSPKAKHYSCSPALASTPLVAPPAVPPSRWATYEGTAITVEDRAGNRTSGTVTHHRVAAWSTYPAIDRWVIQLRRDWPRKGSYLRELKDSDRFVGEYVIS